MNYVLDHLWAVIDNDIANAQIDTANARIAELEAAYCLAMLRIGVLDGILSITNPTTEEAPCSPL
jgi:hypothetical protein